MTLRKITIHNRSATTASPRKTMKTLIPLSLLLFAATVLHAYDVNPARKKLIQWGWDAPSPQYLLENIAEMEKMPFDGVVIRIPLELPGDEMLAKSMFHGSRITYEMVADDIAILQRVPFKTFSDNFVRINLSPSRYDWFADFSVPLHNLKIAARVAKESGLKGLVFDIEQYNNTYVLQYPHLDHAASKTIAEYAAQVERRAVEIIETINAVYPDITIIIPHGYHAVYKMLEEDGPLEHQEYGLLPSFLSGLTKGASDQTVLIDGYESSYSYTKEVEFLRGYHVMTSRALAFCPYPDKFRQVWRGAFAIWLDCKRIWDTDEISNNFRSPDELARDLGFALQTADEYAWLYNQYARFWSQPNVPPAYIAAIAQAREKGNEFVDPSLRYVRPVYHMPANLVEFEGVQIPLHWQFKTDPGDLGRTEKWYAADYDDGDWDRLRTDRFWEHQGDIRYVEDPNPAKGGWWKGNRPARKQEVAAERRGAKYNYDGYGWYRVHFVLPANGVGKPLRLYFPAVDHAAWIYLNGEFCGDHDVGGKGWNQPFAIDISPQVLAGDNLIAVRVYDNEAVGGIWKPVVMVVERE